MTVTTDAERRNKEMESTVGCWIRRNYSEQSVELWIDGRFQACWPRDWEECTEEEIDIYQVAKMLSVVRENGVQEGKRRVRVMLGMEKGTQEEKTLGVQI